MIVYTHCLHNLTTQDLYNAKQFFTSAYATLPLENLNLIQY